MNTRKLLIAVAAVAALSAPLAPAAFAGDDYRRDGDRGGYRDGGWDRGDRGRDHDHDHHYDRGRYEKRYVVRYHLDGGRGRVQVKSGDRAERTEDFLRSVGADAKADGRTVFFRMRGERREVRRSHEDAHKLAQKLSGYGFHAKVVHD